VAAGNVIDVSDIKAAPIFRIKVYRVSDCSINLLGKVSGWLPIWAIMDSGKETAMKLKFLGSSRAFPSDHQSTL
jgi:hypothetical protein